MSDLQIGLIALGVLLIVIVLALNWWQDRRVRRQMQDNFPPSREDPLLGERGVAPTAVPGKPAKPAKAERPAAQPPRREPALASVPAEPDKWETGRREPAVGAAAAAAATTTAAPAGDDADEPDAACEAVIDLVFAQPVPAEDLLPAVRDLRHVGQKPLRVFFRTVGGTHCASLRLEEQYAAMQIAVLLANRSGPLTATEWAQAWARAQRVADQFDAEIEGPDPKDVTGRARELDEICAALDTSVGLTLVPQDPHPWRIDEVLAHARRVGFTESVDGDRLEWLDDNGAVRFTLQHPGAESSRGAATRLNLLLDVPRSPASETAFADMARVARELAVKLNAGVVDDNGNPLAEGSEAAVDAQLRKLYAELANSGLPAGSPRSLRMFA